MQACPELEYKQDFHAWTQHQIDSLRQKNFSQLDIDHLIEELEDMAGRDKDELVSRLVILIAHLLKWQYQHHELKQRYHNWYGSSWRGSIIEQRVQIERQLRKKPGLKPFLEEAIAEAYPDAVKIASKETSIAKTAFPVICPYTIAQLFDEEFYPDNMTGQNLS
jgi:hypothetical protein